MWRLNAILTFSLWMVAAADSGVATGKQDGRRSRRLASASDQLPSGATPSSPLGSTDLARSSPAASPPLPTAPATTGPLSPTAPATTGPLSPTAPATTGPLSPTAPATTVPLSPTAPATTGPLSPTAPATTGPLSPTSTAAITSSRTSTNDLVTRLPTAPWSSQHGTAEYKPSRASPGNSSSATAQMTWTYTQRSAVPGTSLPTSSPPHGTATTPTASSTGNATLQTDTTPSQSGGLGSASRSYPSQPATTGRRFTTAASDPGVLGASTQSPAAGVVRSDVATGTTNTEHPPTGSWLGGSTTKSSPAVTAANDDSVATSLGFIVLYIFGGLLFIALIVVGACRFLLSRAESKKLGRISDGEMGLLYEGSTSPGDQMQQEWNGNPVFGRSGQGDGDNTIQEMNVSDDSDNDATSLANLNLRAETHSTGTEATGPDSRSETLPRSLTGQYRSSRTPQTLEFGGTSGASTPGDTWHRDHSRRSDEEGREGGDEEEFSGREDMMRSAFRQRSATLDASSRHAESRSFKRKRFANFRSKSEATSPMQETPEEIGKLPPPLPGESLDRADEIRRSTRRRPGNLSSLPAQLVAPALPLGAPPPPPPIPKGGFQPPTSPLAAATPALLSASSTTSVDTSLSEPAIAALAEEAGATADASMRAATINEDNEKQDEPGHYALVGQSLELEEAMDDLYLAPADDSAIRYSLIRAKTSAVSERSMAAESPESLRRSSRRSSSRHVRKTPMQKNSASSLQRRSLTRQWKEADSAERATTLPRLPYYHGKDDDDDRDNRNGKSEATAEDAKPASFLTEIPPDSVSQSALSRLDESASEPEHPASSLAVMAGGNVNSREQLLDSSSASPAPYDDGCGGASSQNTLTDDAVRSTPSRVLSKLDAILRAEATASSVADLMTTSPDATLEKRRAQQSPTKRKLARTENGSVQAQLQREAAAAAADKDAVPSGYNDNDETRSAAAAEACGQSPATHQQARAASPDEVRFDIGVVSRSTPIIPGGGKVGRSAATRHNELLLCMAHDEYKRHRQRTLAPPSSLQGTAHRTCEPEEYYLQHVERGLRTGSCPAFY